jgi:MFS family permease
MADRVGAARENAGAARENAGIAPEPASDEPAPRLITPAFVAVAAATLAFFISAGIVLPVAPRFAEQSLGADQLGIGVAIASFSIAALILRPIVGWSSDRFGRRPLLIVGSLLAVAALALALVVGNAFLAGALSAVHGRYQSRITWPVTLLAVAAGAAALRPRTIMDPPVAARYEAGRAGLAQR